MIAGMRGRVVAASVLFVLASGEARAAGDPDACIAAYTASQRSRKGGKLLNAQAEAQVCASEGCPDVLRKDCVQWLDEITRAVPYLTVAVQGPDGCDRTDVRVSVDGHAVVSKLDGRALRHVVEVRHDSFCVPEFVDLIRQFETPVVFAEHGKYPAIADVADSEKFDLLVLGMSATDRLTRAMVARGSLCTVVSVRGAMMPAYAQPGRIA